MTHNKAINPLKWLGGLCLVAFVAYHLVYFGLTAIGLIGR